MLWFVAIVDGRTQAIFKSFGFLVNNCIVFHGCFVGSTRAAIVSSDV